MITLRTLGKTRQLDVAAFVVAAGIDPYVAEKKGEYGYGQFKHKYPNIAIAFYYMDIQPAGVHFADFLSTLRGTLYLFHPLKGQPCPKK